jgi:hypothetical protein
MARVPLNHDLPAATKIRYFGQEYIPGRGLPMKAWIVSQNEKKYLVGAYFPYSQCD